MDVSVWEIIEINRLLGGELLRDRSLTGAAKSCKGKGLYRRIALMVRAILVAHPFSSMKKCTAFNTAVLALKRNQVFVGDDVKDRLAKEVFKISKHRHTSIKCIERGIRYAVEGN